MTADCSVYVIGFDLDKGPSKVGIARDPVRRMASLQTAHFQRLFLAGSRWLPSRELARALEVSFHETRSERRLSGEWFDIRPGECMAILMIGLGVMLNVRCRLEPWQVDYALKVSRSHSQGSL